MNKNNREKREEKIIIEGSKTEEGKLKIAKIQSLRDSSYNYKINAIFWGACAGLETLIHYATTERKLENLIPISLIPLVFYIYQKIRTDKKVTVLEDEVLNNKVK